MTRLRPRLLGATSTSSRVGVARAAASAALCLLLVVAGTVLLLRHGSTSSPKPAPRAAAAPNSAGTATLTTAPRRTTLIGKRTGDVLVLPSLHVRAPLVSVAMDRDRSLNPPRNPREVGWWSGSADVGSGFGQTLVTGHTVHTGGGALDRLGTLQPGAQVVISRPRAALPRVTYRVTAVHTYSKAALARQAQELFGQDHGDGQLQLVTCTGWDGREYSGNVIVTAVPQGQPVA